MAYTYLKQNSLLILICLTSLLSFSSSASEAEWLTDGRVIAMSDIHGAHADFLALLKGLELIDADGHWLGGEDHLVIVGDVLDRGAESRDVMSLLMQLEAEAKQVGGRVHLLLGNHEIMNLVGDLRYVAADEYARYADMETAQDRSEGLEKFRKHGQNGELGEVSLREGFNKAHPPGFFGHRKMFSSNGEFGSWLLQRPAVIKVNDSVFVHGGLSPSLSSQSIDDINRLHRQMLTDYLIASEYFIQSGVLEAATNFFDQPGTVKKTLELKAAETGISEEDQAAVKKLFAAYRSDIFADDSPTWYRGNVGCSVAVEKDRLSTLLHGFSAKRLVVGHTPTASRSIESRFDGMLIRVDTGMLKSRYRGQASAAIIKDDKVTAYYIEQPDEDTLVRQIRQVGPRPGGLSDTELEQLLMNGDISLGETGKDKITRLDIKYDRQMIGSKFSRAASIKRDLAILPEVATYRLDQHLGLEMTPVAVSREVNGERGAVTIDLDNLIDEDQRMARQLGASAWCPIRDQFNMMYLFDMLLHNKGRKRNAMRYITNNMQLMLSDNARTLGTERSIPKYLKKVALSIPADVRQELVAMDLEMLKDLLGDVLDEKRLKAILSRRDQILKQNP